MATSYNGWTASPDPQAIGVVPLVVNGVSFAPGVRSGDVHTVLGYVATQYNKRVEPLGYGCWGYAFRKNRNADNISCHGSATAIDANAPKHPNGKRGTFSHAQVQEIRAILAEVDNVVRWGGDFGTVDEMHFEIHGDAQAVAQVARKLTASPVPTKPTVPSTFKLLERGATGDSVKSVQGMLNAAFHKYPEIAPLQITGVLDERTYIRLREWQKRTGIAVDGVVGPQVMDRLRQVTGGVRLDDKGQGF